MNRWAMTVVVVLFGAVASRADERNFDAGGSTIGLSEFFEAQRVSGALRLNYFRSSKRLDDDTDFLGATAQIKALPRLMEAIDGKVEARITNPALGEGDGVDSRLLEGYVTAHFAHADLRIGKQIVAWGRADGINPTDNLTARDYVSLLPFEDDQRFGTVAVKLDVYLSAKYSLGVFTTPFFEPSNVPLPAAGRDIREKTPARTFSNSEIGLKLDKVEEGFDWSLSYFHGFSLLPDLRILGIDGGGPILEMHYDRIDVIGADFARNIGRYGFRGEAAYVQTKDKSGGDPAVKNPYLFWVLGVDRSFFENLNINLQFFQRRVRRFHDPEAIADPVERSLAVQNAVLDGQRDRLSHGLSTRVADKWFNETLQGEIFAVINLTRRDYYLRPSLTYAFSDHWKGTIGGDFYYGAADTQFGSLRPNRGAFAEWRYGF